MQESQRLIIEGDRQKRTVDSVKNCGIVKKRLDDIINEPILKEQIYQEQQLEEQRKASAKALSKQMASSLS